MDAMANKILQGEEPIKKRHTHDMQRMNKDDRKAENYRKTWDAGFEGMCDYASDDDSQWMNWFWMETYAKQGRDRDRRQALTGPPYDINDPHDWTSGRDFPTPEANSVFFLQFAVVIKRFRNYLDWAIENRPGSPAACCKLAKSESKGTEEWYPCYWREW